MLATNEATMTGDGKTKPFMVISGMVYDSGFITLPHYIYIDIWLHSVNPKAIVHEIDLSEIIGHVSYIRHHLYRAIAAACC